MTRKAMDLIAIGTVRIVPTYSGHIIVNGAIPLSDVPAAACAILTLALEMGAGVSEKPDDKQST